MMREDAAHKGIAMAAAPSPSRPLDPLNRAPLVGRTQELAQLRHDLELGLAGDGQLLLLSGEPGIGKTRTAEALAAEAVARGAMVIWGRCHEAEWTPPYWPWVQVLRAYAQHREADALRAELGPGAADIVQLVPEIATRLRDLPALPTLAPEQARFRTFDHIAAFLRRAAVGQPLVLIFDDLQWSDTPSLLLLEFVAREAGDVPLVILGTYRDIEVGRQHPLARTVAELARSGHRQRITLRGLSESDVGRLVAAAGMTITPELVAAVYDKTEGNPFFVHEVTRLLAGEDADQSGAWGERGHRPLPIPDSVREAIGRRLDRLSPSCIDMLAAASVIGRDFSLSVLAQVTEVTMEQILEALEEGRTARLVEEVPRRVGRYRFEHALIRDTLYGELSTAQKVRLHRRIGLTLEAVYRSDPEPHLAELAHHFVQATPGGDVLRAIAFARRAGERAMALLAFEDATSHFELAVQALEFLDSPDDALRCDLMLALATAHMNAGDVTMGRKTYLHAAQLANAAELPEPCARAALGFGGEPIVAWGFDSELVRVLEDALELLGPEDNPLRAQLLTRVAIEQDAVNTERMLALQQEAEAMARRVRDERALATALIGRLHRHLAVGDRWEALLDTGRELAELGENLNDRRVSASAIIGQICGLLLAGDMVAADRNIEAYSRIAVELRQPFYLFWTPTLYAVRALMDGRFGEAEAHLAEALARVPQAHLANWIEWYAPNVFELRRAQGSLDDAERALRDALADVPDTLDPERVLAYRAMLALVAIGMGRIDDGRQEFERVAADDFALATRRQPWGTNVHAGLGYLAEVCAILEDAPRAGVLYDLLTPYARQNLVYGGTWHVAGSSSHYLGLLAILLERWQEAEQHFEDALAMHGQMGARPLLAATQVAYATMLLRRGAPGDHDRAQALTDAALASGTELGMVRLVTEAAALQATLRHVRANHATSAAERAGLTQREVEVLHLMVGGQSNPQIAASLFISPATARTHVSNIFAKLGVISRTEAVDYAHRHGLLRSTNSTTT